MSASAPSYYQILELADPSKTATTVTTSDIRKAYRRLALRHHPDRNGGSADSTERFKLINEAYEVLSDDGRRREYDAELRHASTSSVATPGSTTGGGYYRPPRRHAAHVDPFARFDDLFSNDPFFRDAFREMDDEFARRFQSQSTGGGGGGGGSTSAAARSNSGDLGSGGACGLGGGGGGGANNGNGGGWTLTGPRKGWLPWLADRLGVQVQMTSVSHGPGGTVSASSYSSNPRAGTYTNKRTRQYTESNTGRMVTIKSMERDGNTIEDKYVERTLVERRVNGRVEPLERIAEGGSS